jgi:hypothetical protein
MPLVDADTIDNARLRQPTWLLQTWAPKGKVTVVAGPGGIGKSAIVTAMALSAATGQEFLGLKLYGGGNGYAVAHILLEDDQDDLVNSYAAALQHHKISPRVADQVHILGNRPGQSVSDIVIAKHDKEGNVTATPIVDHMIDWLIEGRKDVLIVDPFRYTHKLEENSNDDMGEAMKLWNRVALEANVAVILIHHFRKGQGEGVDKASGAHAITAHARSVVPLSTALTEAEAKDYDIDDHKNNYVRIDTLKVNFQPQPDKAIWFHLVPVQMREGFSVVAAERWYPPTPQPKRLPALPDELVELVNNGLGDGEYYTQHCTGPKNSDNAGRWFGYQIMEVMGVDEAKAKQYIKHWVERGVLKVDEYTSPQTRKPRGRLRAELDPGWRG